MSRQIREVYTMLYQCIQRGCHWLALALFLMCSTSLHGVATVTVTKAVDNRSTDVLATNGQIVTFTSILTALDTPGATNAINVVFSDALQPGATFIPGSVTINGFAAPAEIPGLINLGVMVPGTVTTIAFQAAISYPLVPPSSTSWVVENFSQVTYSSVETPIIVLSSFSNQVIAVLPPPAPQTPDITVVKSFPGPTNPTLDSQKTFTTVITPTADVPFTSLIFRDLLVPGFVYLPVQGVTISQPGQTDVTLYIDPNQEFTIFSVDGASPQIRPEFAAAFSAANPISVSFVVKPVGYSPFNGSTLYNRSIISSLRAGGTWQSIPSNEVFINIQPVPTEEPFINIIKTLLSSEVLPSGEVVNNVIANFEPGDTVAFNFIVENLGDTITESPVLFTDALNPGLTYIPGSFTVNGVVTAPATTSPITYSLPAIPPLGSAGNPTVISFQVTVDNPPPLGVTQIQNVGLGDYLQGERLVDVASNVVLVVLTEPAPELTVTKNVLYPEGQTSAVVGDTVIFTMFIENIGSVTATAPWFIDPLPSGLIYEAGSAQMRINGGLFTPAGDPSVGFSLPSLNPGDVITITFRTLLATFPAIGDSYTNIAEVIYCRDDLEGGCETVSRCSTAVVVVVDLVDPVGTLNTCHLVHRTLRLLTITWDIPFTSIQTYRIFFQGELIAEVAGGQPLFYRAYVKDLQAINQYSVQAIYVGGHQTSVTPVRIE